MDGKSIRMFFCDLLTMALIMTAVPVYADGTSVYDRIVAAITGNNSSVNLANINTQLSNINTGLDNLTEALDSASSSSGEPVLLWKGTGEYLNIDYNTFLETLEPYKFICIETFCVDSGNSISYSNCIFGITKSIINCIKLPYNERYLFLPSSTEYICRIHYQNSTIQIYTKMPTQWNEEIKVYGIP